MPSRARPWAGTPVTSWPKTSMVPAPGTRIAGQHAEQRGLARAVSTDQADGLAVCHARLTPLRIGRPPSSMNVPSAFKASAPSATSDPGGPRTHRRLRARPSAGGNDSRGLAALRAHDIEEQVTTPEHQGHEATR